VEACDSNRERLSLQTCRLKSAVHGRQKIIRDIRVIRGSKGSKKLSKKVKKKLVSP